MLMHIELNGAAQEEQRIAREFAAQRDSLTLGSARFTAWQDAWEERQKSIDASLAELRVRLSRPNAALKAAALKIFSENDISK